MLYSRIAAAADTVVQRKSSLHIVDIYIADGFSCRLRPVAAYLRKYGKRSFHIMQNQIVKTDIFNLNSARGIRAVIGVYGNSGSGIVENYVGNNCIAHCSVAYTYAETVAMCVQYAIGYNDIFAFAFLSQTLAVCPQSNAVIAGIYDAVADAYPIAAININAISVGGALIVEDLEQ